MNQPLARNTNKELYNGAGTLLEKVDVSGDVRLYSIAGGANNRLFKCETGNKNFLLKKYFQAPRDQRDRLGREFKFLAYASKIQIDCVPQPLARDQAENLGLYSWIEGQPPDQQEIDRQAVLEAARFIHSLNVPGTDKVPDFADASDACFSFKQHVNSVETRFEELQEINGPPRMHSKAANFVRDRLQPRWEEVRRSLKQRVDREQLDYEAKLPPGKQIISPSDFGFHNSLRADNEKLFFIDFEYSGFDDPAKLTADFFGQPEYNIPRKYLPEFIETMATEKQNSSRLISRSKIVLNVHRVKWCCILLNDFLATAARRREFAGTEADEKKRLNNQLNKAIDYFESRLK